jgi:hypothetical protein
MPAAWSAKTTGIHGKFQPGFYIWHRHSLSRTHPVFRRILHPILRSLTHIELASRQYVDLRSQSRAHDRSATNQAIRPSSIILKSTKEDR